MSVLSSYFYIIFESFVNIFPFYSEFFGCFVHLCVVCMLLNVCVCPIVLRIFDSVYLNVSYRRSWKDVGQETSQVRPKYSGPFNIFLNLFLFLLVFLMPVFMFFLAAPCQLYPSAFLLAWTVMLTL